MAQPSAAGLVQATEASTGGHGERGCELRRLAALYLDEIDAGRRQAALYGRCQRSPYGEVVDKPWGRHEAKRVADGHAAELVALKSCDQAPALAQVRAATDGARTVLKRIAAISQVITLVGDVVVLAQVVALQKWALVAPVLAGVQKSVAAFKT